jgi:CheY-like chemotaxis protein
VPTFSWSRTTTPFARISSKTEGYDVAGAGNGEQALAYLRALQQPVLVLLDLKLPVLDGFGFIDALTRDRSLTEVNVLAMTGGMTKSGMLGEIPLLQKPLHIPGLLEMVARHALPLK